MDNTELEKLRQERDYAIATLKWIAEPGRIFYGKTMKSGQACVLRANRALYAILGDESFKRTADIVSAQYHDSQD